jgi:hypothetical protein
MESYGIVSDLSHVKIESLAFLGYLDMSMITSEKRTCYQ